MRKTWSSRAPRWMSGTWRKSTLTPIPVFGLAFHFGTANAHPESIFTKLAEMLPGPRVHGRVDRPRRTGRHFSLQFPLRPESRCRQYPCTRGRRMSAKRKQRREWSEVITPELLGGYAPNNKIVELLQIVGSNTLRRRI